MNRLLLVELTRLRWRRSVLILLGACVLVPALVWAGLMWNSRPYSAAEIERVKADIAAMNAEQVADCKAHPENWFGGGNLSPEKVARRCEQIFGDPASQFYLDRSPLDVASARTDTGAGLITILAGLVMLIGTTFVGHDWNSGSMSNQLLFEPRRIRVWSAKALIVFAVGLVVSALVLAGFWAATRAVAAQRDLKIPEGTWDLIRDSAMRGALLIALAGVGAYALTMLFRSTVATLGIMFGVSVGGSILVAVILRDHAERWMIFNNVYAWLFKGYDYYDESLCRGNFNGDGNECMAHLSQSSAATYLLVILAAAVLLSLASFRRRDVP